MNNSPNNILTESDYSKFKLMSKGNRNIMSTHVQKLVSSLRRKNLLHINPIIVNSNMEIIDGQHRFEACKELKIPVTYILDSTLEVEDVKLLNQNAKNWTMTDYLDFYVGQENFNYMVFQKFMKEWDISLQCALSLLAGNDGGKSYADFKEGNFITKDIKKANEIAKHIYDFKYYPGFKKRSFILAIQGLLNLPNYNKDTMIQKFEIQRTKLVDCVSKEQYMKLLEEIYNFKNREPVRFV